jgi:hypothetical protein
MLRLQVAFCADGSIRKGNKKSVIRIKKDYKIKRLKELLFKTNTQYNIYNVGEYSLFNFNPPIKNKRLSQIFNEKLSDRQIKILSEELFK